MADPRSPVRTWRGADETSASARTGLLTREAAHAHVSAAALHAGRTARVGLELEQLVLDRLTPARPVGWDRLTRVVADLPALPGAGAVTVEPGGQIELSTPPCADVSAAVSALRADDRVLREALRAHGLALSCIGADPARAPVRVNPAARYAAMERHWVSRGTGPEGASMMCSTASLQLNLDAGPAHGWARRVSLAHRLGPVLVAVSACSPWLSGRATGWRSTRQRTWGRLDQVRCGPLLAGEDPVREWADYALAAPVMLVRDGATARPVISGESFAQWLDGAPLGREATVDDLDYHLTTLFPPVRLRGWLELRYLDSVPARWWPALAATVVTLLDDPTASERAAQACDPVAGTWTSAARLGLADPALHRAARACMAAAVAAAPPGLRAQVDALAELVDAGRCPGDEVALTARTRGPLAVLEEESHA